MGSTRESPAPAAGGRNTPPRSIPPRLCDETWEHRKAFPAAPSLHAFRASATRRTPWRVSACARSRADSSGCGFLPRFPSTENRTPSRRTRTPARRTARTRRKKPCALPIHEMRGIRARSLAVAEHTEINGASVRRGSHWPVELGSALQIVICAEQRFEYLRPCGGGSKLRRATFEKRRTECDVLGPANRPIGARQIRQRLADRTRCAHAKRCAVRTRGPRSESARGRRASRRSPSAHKARRNPRRAR